MTPRIPIIIVLSWALSICTSTTFAGDEPADNVDGDRTSERWLRIVGLVTELGDRDFNTREAATRQLVVIGEPALPALRVAAREHERLEVRRRADRLLKRILETSCRSESTGMTFSLVEEGEFTMGSTAKKDERPQPVLMKRPFLVGTREVTQGAYTAVMGRNPSWFSPKGDGAEKVKDLEAHELPVDSVTWFDAVAFCNALSQRDGLPAYYAIDDVERKDGAIVAAKVSARGGTGYRLPTEAEWEYACRAGTTTAYHFGKSGAGGNFVHTVSVAYGSSRTKSLGRTTPVGSYPSNAWGLFDAHGNVAEWCGDWYDETYYERSPLADPPGPAEGRHRVLRGGSWLVNQVNCRSSARFWHTPEEHPYFVGFRVARTAPRDMIDGRAKDE